MQPLHQSDLQPFGRSGGRGVGLFGQQGGPVRQHRWSGLDQVFHGHLEHAGQAGQLDAVQASGAGLDLGEHGSVEAHPVGELLL
ncbi:hypothetical protein AWV63_12620 [Micromonospora rifamycinica]|nr:hypothetical protein AWV63_12620 [Micromonospora rifamycinica]